MKSLASVLLCVATVSIVACRPKNDCGEFRMVDPDNDLCVCRPEFTMVGDFCIPNDEVDAGSDSGMDASIDAPAVDGVVAMCTAPEECPDRANATRTCEGMTCGFECEEDWGDCDGDPSNGCETDLTSTEAHCGMCANACDPLLCVDSGCVDGAVQVCAGQRHACARRASGSVACWGRNSSGQLGDGTFVDRGMAVDVAISDVVDLDCGLFDFSGPIDAVTCAVKRDGTVWCWGYGANGQLGNGTRVDVNEPTQVAEVTNATSVSVHFDHVCATTGLGQTWCWGHVLGLDGDDIPIVTDPPFMFPGTGTDRAAIGACFLRRDGGVDCWDETVTRVDKGLSDVQELAGGWFHHCALLSDQTVRCWGSNGFGMLGTDLPIGTLEEAIRDEPEQVQGPLRATKIAAHGFGTCAITETAEAFCWGLDVRQDLSGGFFDARTPYQISGLPPVVDIDFGRAFVCTVLRDGNVACLGSGPLGNGDVDGSSTSAVLVEGL